jgi:anti-sigma28 factor (negative regulator of flagellin synthesis)
MKIGFEISRAVNTYTQNSKNIKTNIKKQEFKDKIDISTAGKELSRFVELANNTEIKNSRVDEIKNLLDHNKYTVDTEKLSQSILNYMKESDI